MLSVEAKIRNNRNATMQNDVYDEFKNRRQICMGNVNYYDLKKKTWEKTKY